MEAMAYEFPCLYCGDTDRPRTEEHVLQKGFDAEMTLPEDVCGDCNTKEFSALDGDLIRYVRTFAYHDHPDVSRNRTILQEGHPLILYEGIWTSVRIDKQGRPITLTQLVFLDDKKVHITMDSREGMAAALALVSEIQREMSEPSKLKSIKTIIVGPSRDGGPAVQPALIRSSRLTYCIRASSQPEADKIANAVKSGKLLADSRALSPPEEGSNKQPWVQTTLKVNFGHIERALAKVAVNFVCKVVGPSAARSPAFENIRNFIRSPVSKVSGEFVGWLDRSKVDPADLASKFTVEGRHTLVLLNPEGWPCVFVILYGRPFVYVRLTLQQSPGALPPNTAVAALFNYRDRTHEVLSLADDAIRFGRRFSLLPSDGGSPRT
jgi:hypothetical protein